MSLTRTELVERLKKLAEREPPKVKAPVEPIMADCYSPGTPQARFDLAISCPDCNKTLTLILHACDFDRKHSKFGEQFYEHFSQYLDWDFHTWWSLKELKKRVASGFQPGTRELEFLEFDAKLENFFQTQVKQDPGYFDSLLGTKGFSILKVYQKAFKKIQEQGLDADLIVPEHCSRCGTGLKTKKFILAIKYLDQPEPVQITLNAAFDLTLIARFLRTEDRVTDGQSDEAPLANEIKRLRKLFGVSEE